MTSAEPPLALVVEDDAAVRMLVRMILARDGWRVLEAPDAEQALAAAAGASELRLLVTDVFLPGMQGAELHARLRAAIPGLRALFVSGDSRQSLIAQGAIDADSEFAQKPFTPSELAAHARAIAGLPRST